MVVAVSSIRVAVDGSHEVESTAESHKEQERPDKDEHCERDGQSRPEPLPVTQVSWVIGERERERERERGRGERRERGERDRG